MLTASLKGRTIRPTPSFSDLPTARGSAEHSRRNLRPTLEPLDIELLTTSFRDLQVSLDLSPYHPTSPTSRLSPDSCLPLDSHISPNSRISPTRTRLSHLSPERDGHVTPALRLSPVPARLGLTSADGNISDSPGTPQRTAPDLLDLSPFVPGAFHHSTPLRNPLNTPLLSPGSPLSPLTPSSSSASSPDLVTQFDLLPALNLNHASVDSPAPPHPANSNGPRPSQTPENILRVPNTPVPVAHPPPQPPMAAPFTMPLRGTKDAPKFQGKIIAELPRFLEDVGILADQAQLDHAGKIRVAIRYAALDEAELWETLESATVVPADWVNFVTAVKQLYPGCEGADRYYRSDLHNLVQEYRVKPMKNREELGEYHRKFQKVAAHLISTDKLSVNERDLLFLDGLPHALTVPVRARLQYKVPDVHPSDPYPMASTLEAANFCLTGASLRPAYSPYTYNQPPQTFQQQPASAQPRNPAPRQQPPAQTTTPPATNPALGTVMKQEYPAPGSQAARIATCAFCQDPSHFVPSCQLALAYINEGKLSRRNGRLCMPDGSPIPRIQGIYGMRNVVDHLLAQPAASTESTSSSGFVRDPPPHITAALYTTAYGDDNSLEMELEVEPLAFLHTSSGDLAVPDSSEVTDPEFQAFLANAWANFQAGKGKGDQSRGKKMRFDGVEIPRRKAPRVTVEEEIESPAVREARTPGTRKSSPLSQSTTPESLPSQDSPSTSSTKPIPTTSLPTTARASTQQREPVTSEHMPSKPATPAATAQPATTSPSTLNNGQFRYSFPLADSEAPKHALDQVLGMTVPVPLKELLALSPDLRKHMKEAVTGKRVWGNLLTQADPETPDAQADASAHCFELEGRDPEGIAREYGPKLTYSDNGRIVGNHSIPLRYIEATIVGTGRVVRCVLDTGSEVIAMPKALWETLGLVARPEYLMHMQSVNESSDSTIGVIENLGLDLGVGELYLQVQVIPKAPFHILLGRPFHCLMSATTEDFPDGKQLLTLRDPNTGKRYKIPTRIWTDNCPRCKSLGRCEKHKSSSEPEEDF
ncbi:hypothetical protein PAXINDRAFT_18096 [Paxillus involutus ATCC 200175]|uniref:Unplaced genomic scaffold PAXINscaffold_233, whole genome shotgun sequence n=2 Tax=Paxillus involutus ATCC 200175 TaxID=664439 RepID=A0A0C9TLY7_PAXIN|nr:hypothetical protein PAXINDRAFT_18096 [Paxillus involutus ATCC 200175]